MNQPQVYMCPPSWTPLPPPSPSHPSVLYQGTSFECPVSCTELGLAIYLTYGNIQVSMLFSQIIPPLPSPTESKSLLFISVSLLLCSFLIVVDPVMQNNNSNKIRKQHCRVLGGAEGFVPISLYMKILLPQWEKKKKSQLRQLSLRPSDHWWGNCSSSSIGARPNQAHKASIPLEGRDQGQSGSSTHLLYSCSNSLLSLCWGWNSYIIAFMILQDWKQHKKAMPFFFFLKFPPKRFCNLLFKLIYSFWKIHTEKTGELSVA